MALFGSTKKGKAAAKTGEARKHTAHAVVLKEGAANDILTAPWFSEKALILTEKGVYTFAVPAHATKATIAGAIKEVYNVTPKAVRIVNMPGKKKSMRTRRGIGVRSARRKAYVYLNKGDSIQFA